MKLKACVSLIAVIPLAACAVARAAADTTADRLEIIELLNRHQIYIDLRDAEGYASVYAEDGSYESPFASARGTKGLIAMSTRLHQAGFTAGKRHFTGPMMIDIKGDRATALSYWWVAEAGATPRVYATGTYRDELRKINGHWKIVSRVQTVDSGDAPNK
jgi:hypothetical protein